MTNKLAKHSLRICPYPALKRSSDNKDRKTMPYVYGVTICNCVGLGIVSFMPNLCVILERIR